MEKESTITFRLTQADKDKISRIAKRCGLSKSEYLKQRALGYEPRAVPPDALFTLLEKIGELQDKSTSPETNNLINKVLHDVLLLDKCHEIVASYRELIYHHLVFSCKNIRL